MAQTIDIYNEAKRKEPDLLVLMRCGDFYETYNKDAETCGQVLGIIVTRRNVGDYALAGFPHHALDNYLPKLIRAGHRVHVIDGGRDTVFKADKDGNIVFTEKKTSNNNNQKTTTTMEKNFAAMRVEDVYWFNRDREALVQLVLVRSNFYLDSHKVRHEWAEKDGDPKKIVLMTDYDPETPDELPRFYATTEAFEKGETIKHGDLYEMADEQMVCDRLLRGTPNTTSHKDDEKGVFVWAFVKGQAVKWYFRKHIDVVTLHYKNGCVDRATCDADGGVPENYYSCEDVYDYNDWTEVKEDGERVKHEGVYNRLRLEPDQEELADKLQQAIDACKAAGMDIYFNYASYDLNAVNVRHIERLAYDPSVDEDTEEAHFFDDSRVSRVFKNVGDLNTDDNDVKFVIKKK